ncbi:MAG: hypothetical protein AABN34_26200 [Acidobacteriota bacterium]
MTARFCNSLRNIPRAIELFDSVTPVSYQSRPCKTGVSQFLSSAARRLLLIAVFAASIVTSRIALAQQTGPPTSPARPPAKIPAESSAPRSGTIPEAWPAGVPIERVSDVGRHKAVIFSPDFAEPGNREVYERLGFLYIEDASWRKALNEIIARNYWHPEDRIETIILETHGTNGHGLKLQAGPSPRAGRSYISIAALQEKLEGLGVRLCVIGACNAGRLFRPEIYETLNPRPQDRLFLPATLGIINASKDYSPAKSKMIVVRRAESEIETTSGGDTSELSSLTRVMLGLERPGAPVRVARPLHFAVSNLLIQMLIHDPRLKLTASGYTNEKSRNDLSEDESDVLFQRLLSYIDSVATREYQISHGGRLPAASGAASPIAMESSGRDPRRPQTTSTRAKRRSVRRVID